MDGRHQIKGSGAVCGKIPSWGGIFFFLSLSCLEPGLVSWASNVLERQFGLRGEQKIKERPVESQGQGWCTITNNLCRDVEVKANQVPESREEDKKAIDSPTTYEMDVLVVLMTLGWSILGAFGFGYSTYSNWHTGRETLKVSQPVYMTSLTESIIVVAT